MFAKLDDVVKRFEAIESELFKPELANQDRMVLAKERSSLEEVVGVYRQYLLKGHTIDETKGLLKDETDPAMRELAREELNGLNAELESLKQRLTILLLPKDPNDAKNVILEIRAGTGGEEASLFASDLFRMYQRYADNNRWRVEQLSANLSANGGFKEVIALVSGTNVYSNLKFERGVHRVQRVPITESQGRVHTSACTVAILPEGLYFVIYKLSIQCIKYFILLLINIRKCPREKVNIPTIANY